MEILTDEARFKALLKEALLEVLEERRDILYELLADVIEDIAMARAIQEGEITETISKQEVINILEEPS